jgi:hypothetical protein
VTSVGTSSFTLATHKGASETIDTTPTTTYREQGTPVAPKGLAGGENVAVQLDPSDSTPTADSVTIVLDHVGGKVSAVTSSTITLSGPRGTTREVAVSPSTVYYDGSSTVSGVSVGEYATAYGTPDGTTPSEIDAQYVDVDKAPTPGGPTGPTAPPRAPAPHRPAGVSGKVTSVGTNSFTISTAKGTSETIATAPSTTYHEVGTPTTPSGLATGENVAVQLDPSDSTPTAQNVLILLDRVSGKVTGVTSSTLTLAGPRGTQSVAVSPSTVFYEGKNTVSGATVGEFVTAFGAPGAGTPPTLDASFVDIDPTPPPDPQGGTTPKPGYGPGPQSHPAAVPAGSRQSPSSPPHAETPPNGTPPAGAGAAGQGSPNNGQHPNGTPQGPGGAGGGSKGNGGGHGNSPGGGS